MSRNAMLLFLALGMTSCAAGSGDDRASGSGDGDGVDRDGDSSTGDGNGDGDADGADGSSDPGQSGTIRGGEGQITVVGEPASVDFSYVNDDDEPVPGVVWSTDDTRIGSISSDGTFTANGYAGGTVTITARSGQNVRTVELVVDVDIVQNPGGVSDRDRGALEEGGSDDGTFRWLYPYTGTVFPRGIAPPSLQLDGTAASALYTEITGPHYRYRQFASAASPARVVLPDPVWRGLSLTVLPPEKATVSVSKMSGSEVTGPAKSEWNFASADLTGIVYYSTYNYRSESGSNGAIMRIRAGQDAEVVQSGCTVCHTVSANGNVLATGIEYWAEGEVSGDPETFNPTDSATFDLTEGGGVAQRFRTEEGRTFSFMALSPNGEVGLTSGVPPGKFPPFVSRGVYSGMGFPTELIDTETGRAIASPSLEDLVSYAQTPAFSPDGKHVVFVDGDRLALDSNDRVLSVMDVDLNASPVRFSKLQHVVEKTNLAVAWPTFLPDGNGVIYHEGDSHDSSLFNQDANGPAGAQYAELRLVDVERKRINPLRALNGRDADGNVVLPFGEAEEARMNYEASVLPVAVGGYYWVLFASRRAYGNTIAPGGSVARGDDPWGTEANPSPRKKIWIAAIDVNYGARSDPSHPALYLPGQGLEAGNMRAFAALAPCKPLGEDCRTGSDCCDGFCRETSREDDGTPVLECVPPPPACSNIDEPCETAADCCDSDLVCVNNRCTEVIIL